VNGFKDNMNISSGDDEFLMQKISSDTKYKVNFSLDRNSIVKTNSNKSFGEFYQQRKRWASKGLFYSDKSLVIKLILIYLFYFGLVVQPILAFFLTKAFILTLAISVVFKLLFEYLILFRGKKMLFSDLSLKTFLLTELLQTPYIIFAGFLGAFGNLMWKQRRISR
jgi:cellulose synthase/poly-beta-1,6-N-acetylglucosamine synthase-like glycosyltransferase